MAKRFLSPIEKHRIRLRLLEESDLPMTLGWRNQDHIRKWFIQSEIILPEQHQEWFRQYLERDNDYVFIIEETQRFRRAVGQISLYKINWEKRQGEFGRLMIGEADARASGIAKEATYLLLRYAFRTLGLNKIELDVMSDNEPAIAIYRSYGFVEVLDSNGLKKMAIDPFHTP
jgi:RimJ/RimL family protein N-acetyltransferase